MKNFLTLIMALLMFFSFVACTNETQVNNGEEETVSNKTESGKDSIENTESGNNETETENDEENDENPNAPEDTEDAENTLENSVTVPENENTESNSENNSSKSLGNKLLDEFKSVAGSGNALAVAEKLASYSELSVLPMGATQIEPGFLAGFDNTEIVGFEEGAAFMPMMGTIPFVGYVFTLKDGSDTEAFVSKLKSSANLRWNICTEAEEMVTGTSGNKVFFVMCNKSLEE